MTSAANTPIVVGLDGSESALTAARWAAGEAARCGAPLHLRVALCWPDGHHFADTPLPDQSERQLLANAQGWLDEAEKAAHQAGASVRTTTEVVPRGAVEMLVQASTSARMVVVGSRGLGGFEGLLLGSTAIGVTARASCPVVVVRGGQPRDVGPVVVGIDSSTGCDAALEFAFDAAASRSADLIALHTWHDELVPYAREPVLVDWSQIRRVEREDLEQRLAPLRARHPEVPVHLTITRDQAARGLVTHSEIAQLLVVGSRGRGPVTGLFLGSTSQTLVRHAACPVAVVPRSSSLATPAPEPVAAAATRS
jgi:nucleotide-binding universal stress UspA family protein